MSLTKNPTMKMIALLLSLTLTTIGCVTSTASTKAKLPVYKPDPLPSPIEDRVDTVLPKKVGAPTGVVKCSVAKGETALVSCSVPFTGVLIDSYLLAKYRLQKVERDKLRVQILAERGARTQVQNYYNTMLADAVERAKRGWWERNNGWVGVIGGAMFTAALAIGLAFGNSESRK